MSWFETSKLGKALPIAAAMMLVACTASALPELSPTSASTTAATEAANAALLAAQSQPSGPRIEGGAMGAICWAAILEAVSEVGKRCVTDEKPEIRAVLDASTARLDEHFRVAGDWNDAQLQAFKKQMSERDATTAEICGNEDAVGMYRSLEKSGVANITQQTSVLITRPGKPEWGSCL